MYRIYQLLAIFLMFVLHFNYALGNQSGFEVNPCDLMIHSKDIYRNHPEVPNFPSYHEQLPVEFHLNYSIPEQYRPAVYETALAWNRKAGFRLITISNEIDNSQWDTSQQNQISRKVIYWLSEDQYENMTLTHGPKISSAATTVSRKPFFYLSIPRMFFSDTDIFIRAKQNTVMETARWLLTRHLNRMGVEYSEDMSTVELQDLFMERLSIMNSDDFYNMVIKLMEDKYVTLPNGESEDIQSWIIEEINAEMDDIQPLTSFEDFRDLIIREYTLDLTSISNSTVLFKNHLLHEFGHALGLNHNDEPNSLMYWAHITPVPRFPRTFTIPKHIDDLALLGLSCSYNLEDLKQRLPL